MESTSRRASTESSGQAEPPDVPERWSAQRKTDLVLRLLRGEPLENVSRESHVPAHELEEWQQAFLEAGSRGFKRQSDGENRELLRTRAKLGELMMRLELAEGLIEKKATGRSGRPQAMRQPRSPSTQRRYPLTTICQVYRLARSTVYATASRSAEAVPQKRGPKTA